MNPQYAEPYNIRGICLAKLGDYESALKSYDMAIEAKSDYASPYWNKATVLKLLNKESDSDECYIKAVDLNPGLTTLSRTDTKHFEK